jgi:drug/metabolite transporter (DMT)-like permease
MERREWQGVLAAGLSSLLGGSAVATTRLVIGAIDPLTLATLRYAIGLACLLAVVRLARLRAIPAADRWRIALLGVLFFAVFPVLFNAALAQTTAAHGALALATLPLITLVLAASVGAETLTAAKIAGVALAIGGVAFALAGDLGGIPGAWRGDAIMVSAALTGAVFNVASRPYLRRTPALPFTTVAMTAGMMALLTATAPAVAQHGLAPSVMQPGGVQIVAVAYLGVVCAAAVFWLWSVGLEHTTPTRVAVTVTLNPVSAMALGAVMLGEPVTLPLVGGLAAVIGGIVLTTLSR